MAFGVRDRLYLQLRIGGVDIPLEDNLIESIHIVENVRIYVPMLTLTIKDATKFLTRNTLLLDGAPIEVTIEAEKTRSVYYFRLFGFKENLSQGTVRYTIQGYLDVPRYWTESTSTPLRGSVSYALEQIARATGLTYDGLTTADSQLWMPANIRYAEFAREISEHGWVSDTSCCQMAITTNKQMRYRDVSQVLQGNPVQFFSNKDNSDVQTVITDFNVINKSGFFNSASGYKETRIVQSILSQNAVNLKDLRLVKNTQRLMMSQSIHSGLKQNKVVFSPIDVGNVSETYERALYQNRRLSNLYTFGLEFVTPRPVTANLLDVVNCELAKPGLDGVESYSGKFLLTGKVTYVVGINLYQKCEVFRHGLNIPQDATQV